MYEISYRQGRLVIELVYEGMVKRTQGYDEQVERPLNLRSILNYDITLHLYKWNVGNRDV